jgi:hypothetical protein
MIYIFHFCITLSLRGSKSQPRAAVNTSVFFVVSLMVATYQPKHVADIVPRTVVFRPHTVPPIKMLVPLTILTGCSF